LSLPYLAAFVFADFMGPRKGRLCRNHFKARKAMRNADALRTAMGRAF
jgi:hypothetical protein